MKRFQILRAGLLDFDRAWDLQRELAEAVRRNPSLSYLVLLRHFPIYTLGKNGKAANVLEPRGVPIRRIDRGGDVTYHGPGQIVGYPILNLRAQRIGIRAYVERLEEVLVEALGCVGVRAFGKAGCVGVWTARGKIASIGVRVDRGVTMHGFALNVADDLEPFRAIHPCGMPGCVMTSVEGETGRTPEMEEAIAEIFARRLRGEEPEFLGRPTG